VVDREVRAHAAEDRMRARVREARGDARELEWRLQEALAKRIAGQIVVREARHALLEPDARERLDAARVLGNEDPAVVDEGVARIALFDQQAEAIAGAGVSREIEVRGEDLYEGEHESSRLAGPLEGVEQGPLHDAAHGLDAQVGNRLGPADSPSPVGGAGGEGEPRARLVADLGRLVPGIPGDLDRGARPDLPEVGAILPELPGQQGGAARRAAGARERPREPVAASHP